MIYYYIWGEEDCGEKVSTKVKGLLSYLWYRVDVNLIKLLFFMFFVRVANFYLVVVWPLLAW